MAIRFTSLHSPHEEIYEYIGSVDSHILHSICGITNPDPNYTVTRELSMSYTIEYVYKGKGIITVGDRSYNVSAGDFFILPSGTYQHYFSDKKDPWKKIWVTVDGDTTFPSTLLKLFKIDNIHLFKGLNSPLRLEEIYNLFKTADTDITTQLEDLLMLMFAELSRLSKSIDINENPISTAKAFIDKRISTHITVQEVAEYVSMSYTYFSKLFKKTYGISPINYIHNQKIELSKSLLLHTDMSIPLIASQLAFSDIPHFSRTFSSICGMSPSEYRKQALVKQGLQ